MSAGGSGSSSGMGWWPWLAGGTASAALALGCTWCTALAGAAAVLLAAAANSRWAYILWKTVPRDLKALYRYAKLTIVTLKCEKSDATVAKIFAEIAARDPNKIAFRLEDRTLTMGQVESLSNKVARHFKAMGYKKGETVALMMDSSPEYICYWLGLTKIGVVVALINYNLRKDPLRHSLAIVDCKGVIYSSNFFEPINDIRAVVPKNLQLIEVKPKEEDSITCEDAIDLLHELKTVDDSALDEVKDGKFRDNLAYIYTSGTTGLPKAAIISNKRFIYYSMATGIMWDFKYDDVIYDSLPLYHASGLMLGCAQTLLFGITVVLRKKFSASNFWKDCVKYNCTLAQYIGEIGRYLLAVPEGDPAEKQHQVRAIYGIGLKSHIWQAIVHRFNVTVLECYGSTEGNVNLVNIDGEAIGAVGFVPRYASFLIPYALVRCAEGTSKPMRDPQTGLCVRCKPGEPGLLVGRILKSPKSEFLGYSDKQATEGKILTDVLVRGDKYFNSGDVLVMDELGYFFFKDRTGDTYRWKSENVATQEVEDVLSDLVQLRDLLVYGVEVPGAEGKAGMATVVDVNNTLSLESLAEGLMDHLPSYAIPLFLRITKEAPMTSTFKLKKLDLQAEGYNIKKISDPLYLFDMKTRTYKPITPEIYDELMAGKMKL